MFSNMIAYDKIENVISYIDELRVYANELNKDNKYHITQRKKELQIKTFKLLESMNDFSVENFINRISNVDLNNPTKGELQKLRIAEKFLKRTKYNRSSKTQHMIDAFDDMCNEYYFNLESPGVAVEKKLNFEKPSFASYPLDVQASALRADLRELISLKQANKKQPTQVVIAKRVSEMLEFTDNQFALIRKVLEKFDADLEKNEFGLSQLNYLLFKARTFPIDVKNDDCMASISMYNNYREKINLNDLQI